MKKFATIAISGGGSKGAYACGVLQGLAKFGEKRAPDLSYYYCGTSVGALNATLAAQGDLDALVELYGVLTTKDVLGVKNPSVSGFTLWKNSKRNPFHYFENKFIREVISKHVDFQKLSESHLAICASNYLTGALETFYISSHIDKFLDFEKNLDAKERRLNHYHKITNQDDLIQALLASTAIPFFFPPVRINGKLYVDGGVGNNTPLRQAAYFSRFNSKLNLGETELPVCIINDPDRFTIDDTSSSTDIFSIINRSIDIFQNELVSDSMTAWQRINKEVEHNEKKINDLISYVTALKLGTQIEKSLITKIEDVLGKSTAITSRKNIAMNFVMPSTPLVENVLSFSPEQSRFLRRRGVADCLAALANSKQIEHLDQSLWIEEIA